MRQRSVALLVVAVLSPVASNRTASVSAQQPTCLHGSSEVPEQQARRRQALLMARQINSAQVVARQQANAYQPLAQLQRVSAPPDGFVARVTVDQNGYALSIKDSMDPCGFAYFSDQDGTIYSAEVIR